MPDVLPATMLDAQINHEIKMEINTSSTPATPEWSDLGVFATDMTPAINEVLAQMSFYAQKGWGSSEVVGGQLTLTLAGFKKPGDPASDFFTDKEMLYGFGSKRKSRLRVTNGPDVIIWNVTIANIVEGMGSAQGLNALSVTLHGNGAPSLTSTPTT